jgi:Glycosyltransferase
MINASLDRFDPEFASDVYRYNDIVTASLAAPDPAYPLIRTAVPGWDNDARREGRNGVILQDATPAAYQTWLATLIDRAVRTPVFGTPLVCINAWNEWAEGAYLEPDLHFGAAFLNATGRAACGIHTADTARNLLLVGHDALTHGAQLLLLHLARTLRRHHGIAPRILLLGGGELIASYQTEGLVDLAPDEGALMAHIGRYRAQRITTAIVNSAASARVCRLLADVGIASTLLIHEMPRLIQERSLRGVTRQAMAAARAVVFSSPFVRDALCTALDLTPPHTHILPQGNYQNVRFSNAARAAFRTRHGLQPHDFVVLGVGFADLRKGFDLFLQVFRLIAATRADVHFYWIGEAHLWIRDYLSLEIATATATGRFHLLAFDDHVATAYAGADLYALTSREDPLPTTVIEAMATGIPSIAFEGTGGIPDLLRETATGSVVPMGDITGFAHAITQRLDHTTLESDRPASPRSPNAGSISPPTPPTSSSWPTLPCSASPPPSSASTTATTSPTASPPCSARPTPSPKPSCSTMARPTDRSPKPSASPPTGNATSPCTATRPITARSSPNGAAPPTSPRAITSGSPKPTIRPTPACSPASRTPSPTPRTRSWPSPIPARSMPPAKP